MRHIPYDEIIETNLDEDEEFIKFLEWLNDVAEKACPNHFCVAVIHKRAVISDQDNNHIKIYQLDDGSYTAHFVIDGVEEDQVCERYRNLRAFL